MPFTAWAMSDIISMSPSTCTHSISKHRWGLVMSSLQYRDIAETSFIVRSFYSGFITTLLNFDHLSDICQIFFLDNSYASFSRTCLFFYLYHRFTQNLKWKKINFKISEPTTPAECICLAGAAAGRRPCRGRANSGRVGDSRQAADKCYEGARWQLGWEQTQVIISLFIKMGVFFFKLLRISFSQITFEWIDCLF